ncbi:Oidioi.mRNA.OKI2018_I69.chr1.g1769.t1.cds [Oikopleura dioica]|uniref:Oidioi.mRNA.OKI2018_I69.chr1.g1769.t1.cds n=1 Tax=Oikopleura dioica TaxID=34765 RepID=A0ABN7SNY7_OIKDI|nr:Oidioi.mRNA.OKI2018_I69.chr1.g1769.t1.cds [Oikopleura dioica]
MNSQYMPEGAYGGGLGGDAFDPFAYIHKPRTWVSICAIRWAAMDENPPNTSAVNSSLFLLFLAVAAWGSSGFFVYENYKEGVQINFANGYIDPDQGIPNQFTPNQDGTDGILDGPEDSYQTQQNQQEQYLRLDE